MKYELGVLDRLAIVNMMPARGNVLDLRIARDLIDQVGFPAEEQESRGFTTTPTGGIKWKDETPVEFDLAPRTVELIRKVLGELNAKSELTRDHLGICDLFEFDGS